MIWRDVPSFPGYQASSDGQIKRLATLGADGRRLRELVLSQSRNTGGYFVTSILAQAGRRYQAQPVHRLICEAFHGPSPADKPFALHNDGSKDNNVPDNLRWGSPAENTADRVLHGTEILGEDHALAKLTEGDIRRIRSSPLKQTELADIYGVRQCTISSIILRKTWKHVDQVIAP